MTFLPNFTERKLNLTSVVSNAKTFLAIIQCSDSRTQREVVSIFPGTLLRGIQVPSVICALCLKMKWQYTVGSCCSSCVSVKRKRGKTRRGDERQRRDGALKEKEFWKNEEMRKRETERWMRNYRWLRNRGWNNVVCFLKLVPSSGCICLWPGRTVYKQYMYHTCRWQ